MAEASPFGLWSSPITPRSLATALRLNDVQWDSDGQKLVWLEGRGGQGVLVCADLASGDAPRDLTGGDLSVRARVGYGGGDFTVGQGHVFFADGASGRLFRQALSGGAARPITPSIGGAAAPALSPDGAWLLYVYSYEDVDGLAIVDANGKQWPQQLAGGHDFYMQPTWHPGGQQIAYIAWDHPNMPWDGTTLYLADLDLSGVSLVVRTSVVIAGNANTAIFQPSFSPDGRYLAYTSDATGWGQIYLYDLQSKTHQQLTDAEAEHGDSAWGQGQRRYGWSPDSSQIFFLRSSGGQTQLMHQAISGGAAKPVAEPYTAFDQLAISPQGNNWAAIASSSSIPARVVATKGGYTSSVLRRSSGELVPEDQLSVAQSVSWASAGGAMTHGMLYLPLGYTPGQSGPRPPAIVRIHGGPTGHEDASYQGVVQFFTSRGYTFLDVNYRGSTSFGREYMLALREQWGVVDVEDAVSGARFLGEAGHADPGRIVIYGSSAGGYTVLEALCRAPGVFRAGLCLYGVSNLFTLAADTHKFEARYLDSMIGPLPEAAERYRERSPIFHADLLKDPIAIFQGSDDKVVPISQAESIVAVLRRRGVPHEYHVYQGEGHGWRKPETIEAFYKAVDAFLRQYVIFA